MSEIWTPNDYSNIITIGAAAVGSVLLIVFKSRCVKINLCCGLFSCDRKVVDEEEDGDDADVVIIPPPIPPTIPPPIPPPVEP